MPHDVIPLSTARASGRFLSPRVLTVHLQRPILPGHHASDIKRMLSNVRGETLFVPVLGKDLLSDVRGKTLFVPVTGMELLSNVRG